MKIKSSKKEKKFRLQSGIFKHLLVVLVMFTALQSYSQQVYTEANLIGKWKTKVNEPVDGKCIIYVEWKSDHTTDVVFTYKNAEPYKTRTFWSLEDNIYHEQYEDGSMGKASIKWINKNKFALTIIENQETETYKGITRVYKRTKK